MSIRFLSLIMKSFSPNLILCLVSVGCAVEQSASNGDIEPFLHWLLDDGERLEDVRFAEVAEAVSSFKVLPVDTNREVDAAILRHLQASAGICRHCSMRC